MPKTAEPEFPHPIVTVDVVLFTLQSGALSVLLIKREGAPFAGKSSLPGGYVHAQSDTTTTESAERVLLQKASLDASRYYMEQLATFSGGRRDPRGWSVSVVHYAVIPEQAIPPGIVGRFVPVSDIPKLAFDHNDIVLAAAARLQSKSSYSTLPAFLLESPFTIGDLHQVYEHVLGIHIDLASFRRRMIEQQVIEESADGLTQRGAHRPSRLYKLANASLTAFNKTLSS